MDSSLIMKDGSINHLPLSLTFSIFFLLGLPLVIAVFGGSLNNSAELSKLAPYFFIQTILHWSGFSLALIILLLSVTQYKLWNDKIAITIGFALLFSGFFEAFDTELINNHSMGDLEKHYINGSLRIFSNIFSGLIVILGLVWLNFTQLVLNLKRFALVSSLVLLTISALIYYILASSLIIPESSGETFYQTYEVINLFLYVSIMLFIYPKAYRLHPTVMTQCIAYMALTQIFMSAYLLFLAPLYSSIFLTVDFLKLLFYLVPLSGLMINYFYSYTTTLNVQKRLVIQQKELKYLTSHDALTNLFNRREFEDLLDKSIANAQRYHHDLALILIDLDNFKSTNDLLGHIQGDLLLKQFCNRLTLLTRKGDLLSRIGGDEFTVISLHLKSPTSARQLAERILNEMNSPYILKGKLITITVSVGIALFPTDADTTEDLLRKADLALNKSKQSGKNTYQFYTEALSYEQHREAEIESHLRKALEKDEFELYYQPKYNLLTNKIIGAEILLRWHSEVLGPVSPSEFIPIAENTGLIINLGYWILSKSCQQILHWHQLYGNFLDFSVNISPIQLMNLNFIPHLRKTLKKYQFPTKYLEFEITENALMSGQEETTKVLNYISKLGIRIALDDFGKAYSSLNRLKNLPIDTLKIDKEFINDIQHENKKVIIVDLIITLAKEFNMNVIAEGIEKPQQLNYLIGKECFTGQGFLFSKPLSAQDFALLAYEQMEVSFNSLKAYK